VIVAPVAVETGEALGGASKATLFLTDPELVPDNSGPRVAALDRLTRSEAEIAHEIAFGKDISSIAKARDNSVGTARTQLSPLCSTRGMSAIGCR
jgi:hypothetical protein